MADKIRIYFLGAGKLAVPVLRALLEAPEIEVLGVATQLDRPAGRHRRLQPTPLGEFADTINLKAERIHNVNTEEFVSLMHILSVDFLVVVSFGQILKQPLLEAPRVACVNVHASLLPKYRGASPIAAAIVNNERKTGVTFMAMDRGLDTGGIYRQVTMPLDGAEYANDLEARLGVLAAHHCVGTLNDIYHKRIAAIPQDESLASVTGKLHKKSGFIDWSEPAMTIEAKVRGYYPWPGAIFKVVSRGKEIQLHLTAARVIYELNGKPGQILRADKKSLIFACGEHALEILKVVPQGSTEMSAAAFLNGHPL